MAKLHFFYSTMNAGKSTSLLQSNHNYRETGLDTMIFLPNETSNCQKERLYLELVCKQKQLLPIKILILSVMLVSIRLKNLAAF